MRTEQPRIESDAANPFGHEAGVLAWRGSFDPLLFARDCGIDLDFWQQELLRDRGRARLAALPLSPVGQDNDHRGGGD
jgi:hypothetical protein